MDSATSTIRTGPFPIEGVKARLLLLLCFMEIPILNANSVDPDQTPRYVASELGLHCLPLGLHFYGTLGINGLKSSSG